ncbi:hypothetical protein PIB30_080477 [Stylosanthes scabra]|uniref:Uncharacterized protein n=1 Tax=Stylosanthes scabra TaxID=79078 RepID=A0ABU6ZQ54_9FABA|nr:hypothetical protein [Stylosanthes scabra]
MASPVEGDGSVLAEEKEDGAVQGGGSWWLRVDGVSVGDGVAVCGCEKGEREGKNAVARVGLARVDGGVCGAWRSEGWLRCEWARWQLR